MKKAPLYAAALLGIGTLGLAVPAVALAAPGGSAVETSDTPPTHYPPCSKSVTDECMSGGHVVHKVRTVHKVRHYASRHVVKHGAKATEPKKAS